MSGSNKVKDKERFFYVLKIEAPYLVSEWMTRISLVLRIWMVSFPLVLGSGSMTVPGSLGCRQILAKSSYVAPFSKTRSTRTSKMVVFP